MIVLTDSTRQQEKSVFLRGASISSFTELRYRPCRAIPLEQVTKIVRESKYNRIMAACGWTCSERLELRLGFGWYVKFVCFEACK